ncbi:MAG: CDP-alcohol phosphatidyltransferase family protein [Chloroflexi bacterium]|nr:CDP-alcohol phosphatidyltransferase family protein [Chloroflexota bacterium]
MTDLQAARYAVRGAVARWFEEPATRTLVRLGVSANGATLIGVALAVGGAVLAGFGQFWIAGLLVLAGATFDMLDGGIARRTGTVGPQGALMDSVLDRVSEIAVLLGLVVYYTRPGHADQSAVILALVATSGSLMVSYVRARAEGLGFKGTNGFLTRPERVVITVVLLIAGQPLWALWILGVGTPLSAAQRFIAAYREAGRPRPDRTE